MAGNGGDLFIAVFDKPVPSETLRLMTGQFEVFSIRSDILVLWSRESMPAFVASNLFKISEDNPGVVFKLNGSFAGHYDGNLWDWLRED